MLDTTDTTTTTKTTPRPASNIERARMTKWLNDRINAGSIVPEIVTLTPVLAQLLLERNDANRPFSTSTMGRIVNDIENNRYLLNGESIVVSDTGLLNDGQHRCAAVVKAGRSIRTLIVFGLPRDSRVTLDSGKNRTVLDYVGMHGYDNSKALGSLARYVTRSLMGWEKSLRGGNYSSNAEVMAVLDADDDIVKSLNATKGTHSRHWPWPVIAYCHWYITRSHNDGTAETFLRQIMDGINLKPGAPALAVRTKLAESGRIRPHERIEIIIRGYNRFRRGERDVQKVIIKGRIPEIVS